MSASERRLRAPRSVGRLATPLPAEASSDQSVDLSREALRQVVALDAARSAQLSLRIAQTEAQAASGALMAIEGTRHVYFATSELDQDDIPRLAKWQGSHAGLASGQPEIGADWAIVPIGRPTAALVYLGRAANPPSVYLCRRIVTELGPMFELSIAMRDRESEVQLAYRALVERTPMRLLAREKLLAVLRYHHGNKSKVAKELNITRATLYRWIEVHDLGERLSEIEPEG